MCCFQLVIFDCDGVLVDSERIANVVFAEILAEVGLVLTQDEMFDTFVGRSMSQCISIVEQRLGEPAPPYLAEQYKIRINRALERDVQPVRGITQVLESIDIPVCVASSGSHEKMSMTLGTTGLLDYVRGNVFSTSEVPRGKPNPDIYLHAARKMGVAPDRCAVIEDSPAGVAGGAAAGMTVFGYAGLIAREKLLYAGAHHLFTDMARLPQMLNHCGVAPTLLVD